MTDIVEHVARAIYERPKTYMPGISTAWDDQREGRRNVWRDDARAAIRATLKAYAEDFWNKVGDLVPVAGLGENATVEQQSAYVEVWHYSELARAFEALLAELDGTESEGR